jgi:hypothetical protein
LFGGFGVCLVVGWGLGFGIGGRGGGVCRDLVEELMLLPGKIDSLIKSVLPPPYPRADAMPVAAPCCPAVLMPLVCMSSSSRGTSAHTIQHVVWPGMYMYVCMYVYVYIISAHTIRHVVWPGICIYIYIYIYIYNQRPHDITWCMARPVRPLGFDEGAG